LLLSTQAALRASLHNLMSKGSLHATIIHAKAPEYLNPLPTPPPKPLRPAPMLFVWGAGNDGQFGMGPDVVDQFEKPQRNTLMEKMIQEDNFSKKKGTGIERLAAEGISNLFVDERGTVSLISYVLYHLFRPWLRCGHAG
jgi:hypothetical protein